jgi:hypothetical protein
MISIRPGSRPESSPREARALFLMTRRRLGAALNHEIRNQAAHAPIKFGASSALITGTAAVPALSRISVAQAYPSRPITMVVPFGPGGPSDIIARTLAEAMRGPLGQAVIIENVAGASGTIGVGRVARAAPDGYMLVLGNWATHVLNGAMFTLGNIPR